MKRSTVIIIIVLVVAAIVGAALYFAKKGSETQLSSGTDSTPPGSENTTPIVSVTNLSTAQKPPSQLAKDEKRKEQKKAFITGGLSIIGRGLGIKW